MPFPDRQVEEAMEARITLTEDDARDAARLFRLISEGFAPHPSGGATGPLAHDTLVERARSIFHGRLTRARHFNRSMFGEPAWDILLLLFINDRSDSWLTATRLAELIEQPFSTVVRWIDYLEKERMIERRQDPKDKRISIIGLLDKGRQSVSSYLGELPSGTVY